MHTEYTKVSRRLGWLLLVLVGLLAACSTITNVTMPEAPDQFAYTLTVEVAADAVKEAVEADYGGTAVVFRPEAGFAILDMTEGVVDASQELTAARHRTKTTTSSATSMESNTSTFFVPEVAASGFTSWSGGFTSWSGGFTSWSGGSPEPTTFAENLSLWDQINLPEAQQLSPSLGAGEKVAVIDTGIDLNHPAFEGKLAPAGEWFDFVDNDAIPMDGPGGAGYGHGTGVAGVILQVAPNVTILPLRVLDANGVGDSTSVVAAVDWAIAHGARVINLSLGSNVEVRAFKDMLIYASQKDIMVIASAGNTGDQNITYPAAYSYGANGRAGQLAVGVGSVDQNDVKSSFSNYGTNLELVAPGEFVTTLVPGSQVGYWSGTSFSVPMVAGVVALALADSPMAKPIGVLNDLLDSSTNIYELNSPTFEDMLGVGRLDVEAFILAISGQNN